MYKINNYTTALYRRNNFGQPCFWEIYPYLPELNKIKIVHGIIGKKVIEDIITTNRGINDEIITRIKEKRKTGYKFLSELKDNDNLPVEKELLNYLNAYLPQHRTTADGTLLPMLAKVYDNANNKLFKKVSVYDGQPKINGLRCFISAEYNQGDMFKPISLKFQSREGTYWNSLSDLEDYLLHTIEESTLIEMIDNHYILDGELYLPGYSVNQINHFVKDPSCPENKLIQYWCYDVAMEDTVHSVRTEWLISNFYDNGYCSLTKEHHLNNKNRFVRLSNYPIVNNSDAVLFRDLFIDAGFEGLILRNLDAEYQFGKRNQSMIKFKRTTDGKFTIVDIYPEGIKRNNIPLLLCKNDINDATFECHINGSFDFQNNILKNREKYIGKQLFISYGERSGINQVPFHIKTVTLIQ